MKLCLGLPFSRATHCYVSSSVRGTAVCPKGAPGFYLDVEAHATMDTRRFARRIPFCSSVKTDMGAAGAVSRLYIANANKKDSGNYSCALADVAAATMVSVHVLNGMFLARVFS